MPMRERIFVKCNIETKAQLRSIAEHDKISDSAEIRKLIQAEFDRVRVLFEKARKK